MSIKIATTFVAEFTGLNGAGSISVSGLKVNDICICCIRQLSGQSSQLPSGASIGDGFESCVTVADQLQQSATTDLSGTTYRMTFFRSE